MDMVAISTRQNKQASLQQSGVFVFSDAAVLGLVDEHGGWSCAARGVSWMSVQQVGSRTRREAGLQAKQTTDMCCS